MIKVFIDFDNTISIGDVGDGLFAKFGGEICSYNDAQYREGKLSSKDCIRKNCSACGTIDVRELEAFVDSQSIDLSFPKFIQWCRERQLDCTIVSDGFDFYVGGILARYGIDDILYFANTLTPQPTQRDLFVQLVPSFPYDDEECTRCACCKRNIMLSRSGEEDVLVYIGDGYSDRCPVPYADIVFAKPELQAFCQQSNISYFEYRTFDDVRSRLGQLLQQNRIHKRQSAEANRRALFLAG
jgi:2-hydroxy-3-keto-5-methylthiopentenyl-1-phosphate phosphatase